MNPKIEIRKNKHNIWSVFSSELIEKNEVLMNLNEGEYEHERNFRTIELNNGHIIHPYGRYTNHSCDPNCYVDKKNGLFVSKRIIQPDEEISFNYIENESNISKDFQCKCNSKNCIGYIQKKESQAQTNFNSQIKILNQISLEGVS